MGTLLEYWQSELLKKAAEMATEKALIRGRQERDMEIAKRMFSRGIDLEMIAAITQLSKEEIKRLLS